MFHKKCKSSSLFEFDVSLHKIDKGLVCLPVANVFFCSFVIEI